MREGFARLLLAALSSAAALVGGEQVLGLLGYPATASARVAHPPHLRLTRRSIEFEYAFETNSLGLRQGEIPRVKPDGEARVLVVGDSFTEGHGVAVQETFSSLLEAQFRRDRPDVRFVNGGLSGTGPLQYGRLFFHLGLALRPDTLLICLYANDVHNMEPGTRPADLYDLTLPSPTGVKAILYEAFPRMYLAFRSAVRTPPANTLEGAIDAARRRGIAESAIRGWRDRLPPDLARAAAKGEFNAAMLAGGLFNVDYWTEALDLATPASRLRLTAMLNILTEICRRARDNGVAVGVVFIPSTLQYDHRAHDPAVRAVWREIGLRVRPEWLRVETRLQAELRGWAATERVPWFDLTASLRDAAAQPTRLSYELDDHWTAAGHQAASRALAPWLVRAGLMVRRPHGH